MLWEWFYILFLKRKGITLLKQLNRYSLYPNGADVINGHAEERAKKLEEMNKAKALLDNMNPEDPQYSATLSNYNKTVEDFKSVDVRFQRIEKKIQQLKQGDENLYKTANELTDECDIEEVDIYVFDVDHKELGNKTPFPEENSSNMLEGMQLRFYSEPPPII